MRYPGVLLVFVVSAASIQAHDLWLIPPEKALPKKPVTIQASIGMNFPDSVALAKVDAYPRKFVATPDGKSRPLKSAGAKDMIAMLEFEPSAGHHVVAVETAPK